MKKYFLIISYFLICTSCTYVEIMPSNYKVQIENEYFEDLDSVKLDSINIGMIEVDNLSNIYTLPKGDLDILCFTRSQLVISGKLFLNGKKESVVILINQNGQMEIIE